MKEYAFYFETRRWRNLSLNEAHKSVAYAGL